MEHVYNGKENTKYLKLLKQNYSSSQAVIREIVNLTAITNLPKGTEFFLSDIHGEYEASIGIDGELLAGSFPVKELKLVQAWAAIHEEELYAAWNKAVRNEPFGKIAPLK